MLMKQTQTTTAPKVLTDEEVSKNRALLCAKAALDKKAENLKILDLNELSSFTGYFVICSGQSERQVQAIANSVESQMGIQNYDLLALEGYGEGRWILMDFGDVIVHIFLDALREYYDLETLWSEAPKVKVPPEYYTSSSSGSSENYN